MQAKEEKGETKRKFFALIRLEGFETDGASVVVRVAMNVIVADSVIAVNVIVVVAVINVVASEQTTARVPKRFFSSHQRIFFHFTLTLFLPTCAQHTSPSTNSRGVKGPRRK